MKFSIRGYLQDIYLLLHLTVCVAGMTGRCSLFGRHHVHTFDGVLYEFPGDCSYLLAGDCNHRSFTLLGDFVHGQRSGITLFLGEAFQLHLSVDGILSEEEKILPLPFASHAVFVGAELGFYKLWSDEFGFSVIIDNSANIAVTLSGQNANQTCGLCGNFNALTDDEYTAQEGFLTENSYDFANSWAVKGANQVCRRISSPSQSCNSTKETSVILSGCSVLLTSTVFRHCAHLVSPEAFQKLCELESCSCEQSDGEDCYCPVLQEYARTCHAHGITLHGWLEESQCFPKCPIGMQYNECTKSCSTTCHSLNIQEICKEECEDGCTCPVGKVLDGVRCVEVSQCSCVHMGRRFPPGAEISQDCNTCVCRHGSWECSNEGCPGECLVVGQSHYKTFDNKFFTFTGQCQYLLAEDCTHKEFSVIIENVQCADDPGAVCTRSVTLSLPLLEDMTVKLKHGGLVSVNGMDVQTPMHHGRLQIQRSVHSSVRLRFGGDFNLDWDGRGRVLLKLGPRWTGRTCGLCGNYNGNQGDDFMTGSGLVEAGPLAFGPAWRINEECGFSHKHEADPCATNPKRVRFAEEACAVMMSNVFSPCHVLVNPSPFQRFCRYDVCACEDGEGCLCSALSAYAAACAARGVLLNWRSSSLCEMECPEGQVYEVCGSMCDRSCRSLSGAEAGCEAERVCEEGCYCPAGKYLSVSGDCVSADTCSCWHDGQLYQPNDVYADHNSICYCEKGSMRCSLTESTSLLSDLFYDDDLLPSRERREVKCPPPLVRAKCEAGENGLECARTCQNLDLPCVTTACIPGCLCPPGTVRHRRDCVPPQQCPCYHNNRPFAAGHTISVDCNTCVCKNRKWECTENVCEGVCRTVGEGHYITFDGLKFSFPGLCQYVLVQDMCNGEEGTFRVLVENEACGMVGHRCAKSVTVYYRGGLIALQNGEVKIRRPVSDSVQLEVIRSGQFYTLLLGKHVSLSWDRGTRLLVHVSASHRGRLCGLCGNFDGNVNNDLMSSNNQLEVDSLHFGNSWKVVPSCADVTQMPSPCNDNIVKLVTVEQSCRVISGPLFKECNSQVDTEPYFEMCVEAACSCRSVGDCECFCDVIAAYAQACSQKGLSISWRSNDLCPMSCEGMNPKVSGEGAELCQWRYNTCGPACPTSCQHPEPLRCALTCVEGCHAHCPPGQLLDEETMQCVDPSQCRLCVHNGQKIAHGNKMVLNKENPDLCQICHCDNSSLSCEHCLNIHQRSTIAPTPTRSTSTSLPFTTSSPEGSCDRAMDLAFLLDGSEALSETEFQQAKEFVLGVVDRFRMGSAHTRATVLLYHSGVKTYDLQAQKWIFKKTVRELHYTGGNAAFLDEAVKYLAINIYDKNKRENSGRIAIILTASANPRPVRSIVRMLRRKDITTLTVALGPGVDMEQINDINKVNPDNRAFILSSTDELSHRLLGLTDYLCTLGEEPEVEKPPTPQPTVGKVTLRPLLQTNPTQRLTSPSASILSPITTSPSPILPSKDVTFIVEGSDSVGEFNFNKTILFLEEVISKMAEEEGEEEEIIRITVIQYSVTVTVEISRWEIKYKQAQLLLQRLRRIPFRGGSQTNSGAAITTVKPSSGPTPAQLVFLVTENPPTDTVTRPPSISTHTHIYPIGVGPKVHEIDLFPFSFPQRPLMVDDYSGLTSLVHRVVNITKTKVWPRTPTLLPPPTPTETSLPPSVPCTKPVDVLFLLKAGEKFEAMKMFVKAFITNSDIGPNRTQVSVLQYGDTNTAELTWKHEQSKQGLLKSLESLESKAGSAPTLGSALQFAVRMCITSVSGGRVGVAKAVVMLVTDKSTDDITAAANEALAAGVSVFPIGIGPDYDRDELRVLGRHGNQDNTLYLTNIEQLVMLLMLDRGYIEKICRAGPPGVCVDDDGNQRTPGESWLLEDGCHSLMCQPSGVVTLQNHKVSCDRLEPPTCRNNMPPVRVEERCGCRWECPCMCMGSSTNHVVRFDGLALKLDGEGLCSYTLLTVSKGSEVRIHTGPCQDSAAHYNQVCMKAMEVIHGEHRVMLKDDITGEMDQEDLALPWRFAGLELLRFGGVMLQLKSDEGFTLTFTPQNNEFTISLQSSSTTGHTAGLCGSCGEDRMDVLSLRNGSSTSDQHSFVSDWTSTWDGGVCVPKRQAVCVLGATMGCQALRSEAFEPCHGLVPVQVFLSRCEELACEESDVCELISAYARLCRQSNVCVRWRSARLCPLQCPASMEYDACRTGCVDDCGSVQALPGDWSVARRNESSCMDMPTEGCFCTEGMLWHHGKCVSPDACGQCVDHHGHTHMYMQSWVPEENPCLICMCLDQQRINCTARPCNDVKVPVCGPCETLKEKRESQCCPDYECVCDLLSCDLSDVPHCEDGQIVVLKNPGECQPVYECVCKKEACPPAVPPSCPAHRRLSVRKMKCCDVFECVCSCQNSTRTTCPVGFIMSSSTNDCGCTQNICSADKVCVVGGTVHPVGAEWEEGCEKCSCTKHQDKETLLHNAECVAPACDRTCPPGSTYIPSSEACCGVCTPSSCVEETGGALRRVGDVWRSSLDYCVLHQCVKVNHEVFISTTNVSCPVMDPPPCPLGMELQCETRDCCPRCYCAHMNVCVLNQTLIRAGERMMMDVCTHCECLVENEGAINKYRLSCRRTSCSPCPTGYTLHAAEDGACCGRCVPTACILHTEDGRVIHVEVNTTSEDGCDSYTCSVNAKGDMVLQTRVTTCPPFERQTCLDQGGKVSRIGTSCCETCTKPDCQRKTGTLNYIKVDDCQSEGQIELHYCEGSCHSKSMYSLQREAVEQQCVCCVAMETEPLSVPVVCSNGSMSVHTVLSVTACDCVPQHCT